MTYLKAYGKAVYELTKVLGVIHLVGEFISGTPGVAPFFIYMALVTGLAGPIGVAIENREKKYA